ncbi:hypothetical protein [Sphingomonas sp. GB1N7]|uniref:hypothetical protein n=1 Tax=Parasphingomonas caseinilytica TaxID=3096158 RepID=UPI002FCA685F
MTIIKHDTLFDFAELCRKDPAFIDGFKRNLIQTGLWEMCGGTLAVLKTDMPPPSAPMSSAVTAVQTALFDNWPNGTFVKNSPNRYGFSMEIWDRPKDEIEAVKVGKMNHAFKANISLMAKKNLLSQIAQLRKPRANPLSTVDSGYLTDLTAIAGMLGNDQYIGMLNTKIATDESRYQRGTYYPAYQFVMVQIVDGKIVSAGLVLSQSDIPNPIHLSAFDKTDWQGGPLGHKIKGQSRLDRVGFAPGWATN